MTQNENFTFFIEKIFIMWPIIGVKFEGKNASVWTNIPHINQSQSYVFFVGSVTLNNVSDDSLDVSSKGKDKYQRKMTKIRLEEESLKQVVNLCISTIVGMAIQIRKSAIRPYLPNFPQIKFRKYYIDFLNSIFFAHQTPLKCC